MNPWDRPNTRRRQVRRGGRPMRVSEPTVTRPREISQVSSGSSRWPLSQEPQGTVRRRPAVGSESRQPPRTPNRPAERSRILVSMPESPVQSSRRPREISQVSSYTIPSGPPPGRRPQTAGALRRPGARPREISEQYFDPPYGQRWSNPYQYPPRGFQGAGPTRPPYSTDPSSYPSRPREVSGVSGNMPYYPPSRPTQFPTQGWGTAPQYTPQRPREQSYPPPPYGYTDPFTNQQVPPWAYQPGSYPTPYPWPNQPIFSKDTGIQYEELDRVLPYDYPPETFTGCTELPCGKAWLILLLWLPRLFIPWITAWHDFNVYVMSNPSHWKDRANDMQFQKTMIIAGRSLIAIASAVFVDTIRRKFELEYYVYFSFLVLFTLSPAAAGYAGALLMGQFLNQQDYEDFWFSSIVLTQWAISAAFFMFPVQLACIYSQTDKMSRTAHYNWTSFLVFLEFISAYAAFLVIPGPCPTQDWTQLAVWAGIGLMMITVTMLTLVFLFAVRALKYIMMMMCLKRKSKEEEWYTDPPIEIPSEWKCKKTMLFCLVALPFTSISFTAAALERFVPYENWDDHHLLSALGVFLFWKIIGVLVMVILMLIVRKVCRENLTLNLRTELFFLGTPHVLCILALATMVGRFATLSHLKEGDIVVGPIPDKDKTVLIFVNSMFRNRTICIRSDYFEPVKIRPYQHATRELYDVGEVDDFTVTMEVDPCTRPVIRTPAQIENVRKGEWKIYNVVLLSMNVTEIDTWDYYRTLYAYTLREEGRLRPRVGLPQVIIFQVSTVAPKEDWYYQLNHSELGSFAVETNNSIFSNLAFSRNLILWDVPATGKWTVKLWSNYFNKSAAAYAWATNCIQCVSPLEFEVENNSLYLLVEYYYEEIQEHFAFNFSSFDRPPPDVQFPMYPLSYALFKLGEIAGPNSNILPNKEELQKDWAVKASMALAGVAAGGIYLGFVYLFWVDAPVPAYRTVALAVCWVLMGVAAEAPRYLQIDIGVNVSIILLGVQIVMSALYFIGASFMYTIVYDFRGRPN